MPHIARRLPGTIGIAEELTQQPKAHRELPPPPSTVSAGTGPKPARLSLSLPKINPHTYVPDQTRFLKSILGKEVEIDEDTGRVVPAKPRG